MIQAPTQPYLRHAAIALCLAFALACLAPATAASLDDRAVALAVNERLFQDPGVSNLLIDVAVEQGVVELTGSVNSLLAQQRATRLAETVKGVRAVVDRVEVVPTFRPDDELESAIRRALATHPVTDAYQVDVVVERQRATLRGAVDSRAERRLAERVAKDVAGIESLANRIAVRPGRQRPDRELEREIEAILAWDALIDDDQVEVTVEDGNARLGGYVASLAEKRRAAEQAWIPGVETLDTSSLGVTAWTRDPRFRKRKYARLDQPDAAVADAVRDALVRDPRVPAEDIRVEVDGGKATLTGGVDNLFSKRAAGDTAHNTLGVYRVVNRIRVRPGTPTAETLRDRVGDAIDRHWHLDADAIEADVDNGVVTLSGVVDNQFEKALADAAAAGVYGVVAVDNNLAVARPAERFTPSPYVDPDLYVGDFDWFEWAERPMMTGKGDWAIYEDIVEALYWSPFVDGDGIKIAVDNGRVTLSGTVDAWPERSVAEESAYQGGAVIVDNDLRVRFGPDYYAPRE
jgi:osmotically-inducible protein OsmY